ncbi:MAG: glycosyltransferase [Okeania sp. SIO2G4]|uniref:hormogonium polysaccharide biosynthesis glycosyltransferase HpsP n=1 Tax=unclassified Okeania TaxID=2634635 RepID=UPI0013B5FF7A|nr:MULTISPECIES: hormogonium polysaccharide biosynthesis glycosyltransferase HpsP [unclassified Okeania]NEP06937.1 glycosyltransferase [Okeania sp. SIO4D6]NEP74347.1 glycosyltransferase [Okeania sp. SIO2G5]NEP95312.1 glycosyltransferase [Okeania sp. SIO2F5]NEQ93036.1 glycosyltransferase [Okeania sp. SIO2G4]
MRILQIVPSISLVYGGPSQMVLGLSTALAAQNIDVTILTTDSNGDIGQPPLDVPLDKPVRQNGYQIRYFRCSPFRRYKFSLKLLQWLNQHASEFDLAHIHALFSPVTTMAATMARANNLPYILRPLGTLDPADLRKKNLLKKIYVSLLEKRNIAHAAALHFTSLEEAKVSERFGVSTRDLVIPLGVNPPGNIQDEKLVNYLQSQAIEIKHPVILFMSRIEPKKGLDLLLPALEKLLAEGIDFQFILAGANPQDPNYEAKIRSQIEGSPLAKCTKITGFVTGEIKASLLQVADVFVLPSYYENFGIAVAEAMVAGTPVVISDQVHICQDVADAEAGWVGSCKIEDMAILIKSALQNEAERKQRGLNAKELARKNYSWEAIAIQTIQAYQKIITY